MAELAYAIDGEEAGSVRCDGLVLATPAGSTGYNLANGGPVLAWGVEGYVVSFIAPHSLTARALVVAPGDELTVPLDQYFVLGDNRPNSRDSHFGWFVPAENLIGRAWLSYWPPADWGLTS